MKFDPTNKYKKRLINLLKKIKAEGDINDTLYKKMFPTGAAGPKFYRVPNIHKRDMPPRLIVSSRGTTTYEAAKELARILRPFVGKTPYHIKNMKDFVDQIHGIQLQQGECVSSYDVSVPFASVSTDPAISIIKESWIKIKNSIPDHPWH